MALEEAGDVACGDAAAVVDDADAVEAARHHLDADGGGAGVKGVLDELLDGGRRALDHLTGGDTRGNLMGKHSNGHGVSVPPRGGRVGGATPLVVAVSGRHGKGR